jgi:transposase
LSVTAITQLLTDYQSGSTARELAARYAISKTSVQRLLKEHGIPLRHQGLSREHVSQAIELYEAGDSVTQVATTLNLSASSVYDALKRSYGDCPENGVSGLTR